MCVCSWYTPGSSPVGADTTATAAIGTGTTTTTGTAAAATTTRDDERDKRGRGKPGYDLSWPERVSPSPRRSS